jgi:hypothetical protein
MIYKRDFIGLTLARSLTEVLVIGVLFSGFSPMRPNEDTRFFRLVGLGFMGVPLGMLLVAFGIYRDARSALFLAICS